MARIARSPDSTTQGWLGWPHCRWAQMGPYRPLGDWLTIDIPILMIHGSRDFNFPVESSRLVAREFQLANKPNLTYREYTGYDHAFNQKFRESAADIARWLVSDKR